MHQPTLKMPSVSPVATRLKEARTAAGHSTHALAALIAKRFPGLRLSHASIANYEKEKGAPPIDVLSAIALVCNRPIAWFLEKGDSLSGIRYRFLSSKTGIKERHQFECESRFWIEAYIKIERRLGESLRGKWGRIDIDATTPAREAAKKVRQKLKVGEAPIPSVIEALEDFGIRTIEMSTDLHIDGFAARLGSEPVVVLKPNAANDRCRLNAAHELGHVLFGDCDSPADTTKEMDNKAFEFASHLLIPPSQLKAAFEGKSAVRLVQYKERFGISMAAMIFRAEKDGIISEKLTKQLWIQFSRRGWRAKEPGRVRADRAVRFERLLDQAISEKKLTWNEAAEITGINVDALKQRRDLAMGICADEQEGASLLKIDD